MKRVYSDICKYLSFIKHCLQPAGDFLNYVDKDNKFTESKQSCQFR